ncbi:MAG: 50S ribosomal protein L18e [Candidatus Thermoplasmatota archaeon]|jgi:large subunit ribosomal protein L18e|nr:50S ribosomal protein L18e [Candidatus Thermoplasmatota archaeon]MCL5962955.1 50S ribosomal protein L18e [Candidatus Thermoplasmatota archaeon]
MKRKVTDMELAETINYLKHVSTVENVNIWVDLSERLTKSCNNRAEINLKKINMHGKEGEYIAVPGKVLGTGVISYPFKIAAYKFSSSAKIKIEKAGGKAYSFRDLVAENPKGKNVRILG